MTKIPIIAIVGRPNVGKSTFFNRLLKNRKAIVDSQEGITRDRNYGTMDWTGYKLTFIDTGGYIPDDVNVFHSAVRRHARLAVSEADLILFMVDGRVSPTAGDYALAEFIRTTVKPYILVVNKCDSLELDDQLYLYHELGLEPVLPVSALNGRLTGDLLDVIVEMLALTSTVAEQTDKAVLQLSIVGMPNVGKSSILNALLQKEQTIVTPIAGTTRDSIDTSMRWYGHDIVLVDTAGLRKKSKAKDDIEYYSNVRTHQAIGRSDVVLVIIDAVKGCGRQDKAILDYVIQKGRGLVIIVNKWDLITKDSSTMQKFQREIASRFKVLEHFPILFISALTKQRISRVLDVAWNVHMSRQQWLPTKELNHWIDRVTNANPPPAVKGKPIKIKFITQVHTGAPIFVLFCNYPTLIPVNYRRYLENQLREYFHFEGVPLKFSFRKK